MADRRSVIAGLGTGLGVAVLGIGGIAYRSIRSQRLVYEFDQVGSTVNASVGAPLLCTGGTLTAAQMDGPFYTPNTPQRRDIRDALSASTPLIVTGRVVDIQCQPIRGAVLDFWQTDDTGAYDNGGYGYRGHQYTDANGRFELITIRPQAYTAMGIFRTPHIHVKVQGPETSLLTTQLYLPDAHETNERDGGYLDSLAMKLADRHGSEEYAAFDFVLARA